MEEFEDLDHLKRRISYIFDKSMSTVWTPSDHISEISEYYIYLANALDHRQVSIDADPELISRFESVFLWLQGQLDRYSDPFFQQVLKIEEEHSLCDLFVALSMPPPEDLDSLRPKNLVASIFNMIVFWRSPQPDVRVRLTASQVFAAKRALIRLSHLLDVVAQRFGEKDIDYDNSFRDFKDYFDPDLIKKDKLLRLIRYLNSQTKEIPDVMLKALLTERLEDLEAKIRKRRVPWGHVILGVFALWSLLTDLDTRDHTIYDQPLKTVQEMILIIHKDIVIHKESIADTKTPHLLNEGDPLENDEEENGDILDAPD